MSNNTTNKRTTRCPKCGNELTFRIGWYCEKCWWGR